MVVIDFDRVNDSARFRGIVMRGAGAIFDVCRELTDRGWRDQPVRFVDERGMHCLSSESLHATARRYRPNESEIAAKKLRALAKRAMDEAFQSA
jgi:hypothetical protein